MIGWIVKLLSGGTAAGTFGPWLLLGGTVALLAAGGAGGYAARGLVDAPVLESQKAATALAAQKAAEADTRTAQCRAIHEKGRADGAEAALAALDAATGAAAAAMDTLAAKAAARGQALDQFLTEIANAPHTNVCGTAPAELAFRRRMQPAGRAAAPAAP